MKESEKGSLIWVPSLVGQWGSGVGSGVADMGAVDMGATGPDIAAGCSLDILVRALAEKGVERAAVVAVEDPLSGDVIPWSETA